MPLKPSQSSRSGTSGLVARFEGFDHIDCRVKSLAAVEPFYDALMPELGLPRKRFSFVDNEGEWHEVSSNRRYNTVEYFEQPAPGRTACFIGFIERPDHQTGFTRLAFRVERERLSELEQLLTRIGARNVERSEDLEAYPAIFFEDPSGTKLELVSRAPSVA
jgi:catechol 2,3-dioxygenase-like lactoylglutathione lyase family enzyme